MPNLTVMRANMTMSQKVILLLLLSNRTLANTVENCGAQKIFNDTSGIMKFTSSSGQSVHCDWAIVTSDESITAIIVIKSTVDRKEKLSSLCMTVKGSLSTYLNTCSSEAIQTARLSIRREDIQVSIESARSSSKLWLAFASRNETECPDSDFQCLDKSHCYNSTSIPSEDFICQDHSDQLGSGKCDEFSVPCSRDTEECFNLTQRCEGVLQCPSGQDELNCSELCPNLIKCPREDKCISKSEVCDGTVDCSDSFDEESCSYDTRSSKIVVVSVVFIMCSFCCIVFVCLVFRWVITKRDVNRFLDNLPEIPLAPFRGPGEDETDSGSSDPLEADFRQGGEIYEHYLQNLRKKSQASKAIQVGGIVPKFSHLELDAENEFVVLASLNVPSDMCVGLTVSESSIESIKTLKSIRKTVENDSSGSADTEPIGPVRSRTRVKFALALDANSEVKPKVNFAGGDFFIMSRINALAESTPDFSSRGDIAERKVFVQERRSAPLPSGMDHTPTMVKSRSLGIYPCSEGSSQWTDFEEKGKRATSEISGAITVKTRTTSVEKKLKLAKRSCKKKTKYPVRL